MFKEVDKNQPSHLAGNNNIVPFQGRKVNERYVHCITTNIIIIFIITIIIIIIIIIIITSGTGKSKL